MAEQAENEPSMEEILSSIRRIINEDDDEAPAEAEAEAEPEPAPAAEDEPKSQEDVDAMFDEAGDIDDGAEDTAGEGDVLELTDKVEDEDGGTDPLAVDDDLMIVDREKEAEAFEEPEAEPDIDFDALEDEVSEGIMSQPAASAAMGSFHTLAENIRISEEEGRTLEGVVRALLRPMLKEWLDSNLPTIVDEKVQAEIDRVARRRR